MSTRRAFLVGLGGLVVAGGSYALGGFHEARAQADTRLFGQSTVIDTSAGVLEFAEAGDGPPLMMIHGTGGGFDQGLLFGAALREHGFRIVAPSRFGYLRSAFPDDASPAHQADVLVELLDQLGIDRLPVVGGSAGALMAAGSPCAIRIAVRIWAFWFPQLISPTATLWSSQHCKSWR